MVTNTHCEATGATTQATGATDTEVDDAADGAADSVAQGAGRKMRSRGLLANLEV